MCLSVRMLSVCFLTHDRARLWGLHHVSQGFNNYWRSKRVQIITLESGEKEACECPLAQLQVSSYKMCPQFTCASSLSLSPFLFTRSSLWQSFQRLFALRLTLYLQNALQEKENIDTYLPPHLLSLAFDLCSYKRLSLVFCYSYHNLFCLLCAVASREQIQSLDQPQKTTIDFFFGTCSAPHTVSIQQKAVDSSDH